VNYFRFAADPPRRRRNRRNISGCWYYAVGASQGCTRRTPTYSMTVTNAGKVTATGIVISDALPAGTVFASASASQGAVTAPAVGSNGTVTVTLGSPAKGATISVVVK
jgi:uncharacterized repeat protein (TIGR01451 family)